MGLFSLLASLFGRKGTAAVTGTLVLGRSLDGNGQPLALDDALLRNHMYMSGRQGSGMSVLIEQMLMQQTERGRGWIYVDPMVDDVLLNRLAERARQNGRDDEFLVLDFHKPENSHSYDILRSGTPADRATRILQALPPTEGNPGAEHYRQRAVDLLVPLFTAIDATGKAVGLRELALLLRGLEEDAVQREFLDAIPLSHEARDSFLAALESVKREGSDLKQVLGGIAGRVWLLSTLDESELLSSANPEIVMPDVLANNKMLYIRLPVLAKDSTLGTLARLVVQDAISSLSARAHLPRRLREQFLFVMNGFSTLDLGRGHQAAVGAAAYSNARAMRVSLVPVAPSGCTWSHVVAAGEQSSEILIANTYTKIYFCQHQDEVTGQLHPDLRPGTLDSLALGEFMLWTGTTRYRGLVSNSPAEVLNSTYTRRAMAWAEERPRLNLSSFSASIA